MTALDNVEALVVAQAHRSVTLTIDIGADLMVQQPWRIVQALYPYAPKTWPPVHKSMIDMLVDARAFVRVEQDRARHGWLGYAPGLLAVRCAEEALVRLIAAVGAVAQDQARRVG